MLCLLLWLESVSRNPVRTNLTMLAHINNLINENIVRYSAKIFHEQVKVPEYFLKYLFFIEDKRFIIHSGIDPVSIGRAAVNNFIYGSVYEGASTITQKLFRTTLETHGNAYRGELNDKIGQIIWAIKKELNVSKTEILSEYLRTIYLGRNYYGLNEAAFGYFGLSIRNLNHEQCFFLAERIAWPNVVNTYRVKQILSLPQIHIDFRDSDRLSRLINIYDQIFQCREALCLDLEKLIML
jgi:membrane peptidoglycan carboxypeptidase